MIKELWTEIKLLSYLLITCTSTRLPEPDPEVVISIISLRDTLPRIGCSVPSSDSGQWYRELPLWRFQQENPTIIKPQSRKKGSAIAKANSSEPKGDESLISKSPAPPPIFHANKKENQN